MAALTDSREVYMWGFGKGGRLGHSDANNKKIPTLVKALSGRTIRSIACGKSHSAAVDGMLRASF